MLTKSISFFALGVVLTACQTSQNQYHKMQLESMAADEVIVPPTLQEEFNTEEYDRIYENDYVNSRQQPLSTFSIDVDKASYSNMRRFLVRDQLPPPDAIRIEELINYFEYNYPGPRGNHPFAVHSSLSACPWNSQSNLLKIAIQGKKIDYNQQKPSNLVFLIDVSGSMNESNKLPLVKKSLNILLESLQPHDKVALVVYAGAAGLVLPATSVEEKSKIREAINKLSAGGSTAGGAGIELAYKTAAANLLPEGNNRVILVTDGDFNIGTSSTGDLVRLIEEKRKQDIYLTICGFGMGNFKDGRMEQISNAGNGNYFYIDNIKEADRVFRHQLQANLFTIAKDVKLQLEFNPQQVMQYRLIGYENRVMDQQDFEDDQKDAGELGAGHQVTALYEIFPAKNLSATTGNHLRYQYNNLSVNADKPELGWLKLRYKPVKSENSILLEHKINNKVTLADANTRFAAAVAGLGMMLRDSRHKGSITFDKILSLAKNTEMPDKEAQSEFISLVQTAALLNEHQEEVD